MNLLHTDEEVRQKLSRSSTLLLNTGNLFRMIFFERAAPFTRYGSFRNWPTLSIEKRIRYFPWKEGRKKNWEFLIAGCAPGPENWEKSHILNIWPGTWQPLVFVKYRLKVLTYGNLFHKKLTLTRKIFYALLFLRIYVRYVPKFQNSILVDILPCDMTVKSQWCRKNIIRLSLTFDKKEIRRKTLLA